VAVDAEIGGSGLGQVHVHITDVGKYVINAADDLKSLPKTVRNK